MLRQGLRGSLRSSDALWKTLAEELSSGPVLARDTFSIASHVNTLVQYRLISHHSIQNVRIF